MFNFFIGFSFCYDNLSLLPTTTLTQSSTYKNNNASLAKDGNENTKERYCAHTNIGESVAWLQVDLQVNYSILDIKIILRYEGDGRNDWKPYRFRQAYVDVSHFPASQTNTGQRTRCYTDVTDDEKVPPKEIKFGCKHTARYVIVETNYDAPEDNNEHGAILEICEIGVYGCQVGQYGVMCSGCSSCTTCDVESGECRCHANCKNQVCTESGYCTQGCVDRYWGPTCDSQCPQNCSESICSRDTGHCFNCKSGFWGNNCTLRCSVHCLGGVCAKTNGKCTQGCTSGRYGDKCDRPCSPGCTAGTCDQQSGTCSCKGSWEGDHCDRCASSHYGSDCSMKCSSNCLGDICNNTTGSCTNGCQNGFHGDMCNSNCQTCPTGCDRNSGKCSGECLDGWFGEFCNNKCNQRCADGCMKDVGICNRCVVENFGVNCDKNCSSGCAASCDRNNGSCTCAPEWQGETCNEPKKLSSSDADFPVTEVGAGVGAFLIIAVLIIIAVVVLIRTRRNKESKYASSVLFHKSDIGSDANKGYTNLGSVSVAIEDPDEEPQTEKPEECVYYNNLSVAKDIPVSDLLHIITTKQAKNNEGFLKEFKSLPYGERFPCDVAKSEGNMPKNRFKTTFPYDHSRVVLESSKEFNSDYINANYIEDMDGKREFIASQGPRTNTVVDHWRMIWQEHVNYIVMLTNLIEGPKVKCHQYWPEVDKEIDVEPFSVTLLEEKVYAYFVVRKMAIRKKKVTGSRTVMQFHYTRWPDHGTPDPLDLVDFLRQFRHKIKPSHHPILVHCSAGIGRTGTFIALDVLSRYGKVKGKINVIEYVKAMRKDRMTMIQNVDQYVFLYSALYEFFRRSGQFVRKDDFLSEFANLSKAETKKQLSDEFNELTSMKTKYEARDYKSGKKHQKLNLSKSVLPVERYLVYLTSNIAGRETYYNAVSVSSFTQAEELLCAQFPVAGAAIDLVRLLIDEDCSFFVSLNPLSEVKELKDWVNDKIKIIKLDPYEITKHAQLELSPDIRKTSLRIKGKEDDILSVELLECLSWSSSQTVPADKSILTNLIKQFCLDRKSHPDGRVAVLSMDGAVGCGVFCAVYNAVQQLQQDDEVDMFTIVRRLQVRRPEIISTLEEYELCHDAMYQFLASDSVYANT